MKYGKMLDFKGELCDEAVRLMGTSSGVNVAQHAKGFKLHVPLKKCCIHSQTLFIHSMCERTVLYNQVSVR